MPLLECSKCEQKGIALKDKYLAGVWRSFSCHACGRRLCENPYILAFFWLLYFWDVAWFLGLGYHDYLENGQFDFMYIVYMVVGWLVLDIIRILMVPTSVLRGPQTPPSNSPPPG